MPHIPNPKTTLPPLRVVRLRDTGEYTVVALGPDPALTESQALEALRRIEAFPDLEHAIRSLLAGLDESVPEEFPGHHKTYLNTVAIPRARAALKKAGEM